MESTGTGDPTIFDIFSQLDDSHDINRDPVDIEVIYSKQKQRSRSRSKSKNRRSSPSRSPKSSNHHKVNGISSRRQAYLNATQNSSSPPNYKSSHTTHRPYIRSASPVSRDKPQSSEQQSTRSKSVGRQPWMPFQMHHTSQTLNSPSPSRRRYAQPRSSPMTLDSVPSDEYISTAQRSSSWKLGKKGTQNGFSQDLFEEDSQGRPMYQLRSVSRSRSPPRELIGASRPSYNREKEALSGQNGFSSSTTPVPSTSKSDDRSLSPIPHARSESPPFQSSTQPGQHHQQQHHQQQEQQQQQHYIKSSIQNPFQAASRIARSSWQTNAPPINTRSKSPPNHPSAPHPSPNSKQNAHHTNPFLSSKSQSTSKSRSRSPPSQNARGYLNNNPFVSTSKSNSPPPPRKENLTNTTNPFLSSTSQSSQDPQYSNHNPFYSSRSKSHSPPSKTTHDVILEESKLHNILSCATSPTDPQWKSALHILASSPNPSTLAKSKVRQAHSWTALHIACLSNPPLYIVLALLMVYPDGIREVDSGGRLPLHLASAGTETSVEVMDALVRFYPKSVSVKDDRGLIPLHLALLRDDGGQQLDLTLLRLLLGQGSTRGGEYDVGMVRKASPKRVRDGGMRKGAHLNLQLEQIEEGIFGDTQNAVLQKARKRRQEEMKLLTARNGKGLEPGLSRGFTRKTNSVDSEDGIPHKNEFLASLWDNDNLFGIGKDGILEVENFSEDVKNCLKQLAQWKKKEGIQFDINTVEDTPCINPSTIPAPPHGRLPIHMAVRRNHYAKRRMIEEEAIASLSLMPPKTKQNDILRVLIHTFPASLVHQDAQGCTPLLTCLMSSQNPALDRIDLEMIELLLGIRTAGFRVAPEWLEDSDFVTHHHNVENKVGRNARQQRSIPYNPAMIDSNMNLPLHVAAQEALSPDIIHSIYSCYPGAKYVQNERKCTPLHCILSNLGGKETLDLEIVSLLMDETVVRMKDDTEKGILDLLVVNAKNGRLPCHFKGRRYSHSSNYESKQYEGKVHVYRSVFHHSVVGNLTASPIGTRKESEFLRQLHLLPPWLRRQACATRSVQEVLLRAVAKPRCTGLVISYGMTLLILVLAFLAMVDQYFSISPIDEAFQPTGDYAVVICFATAYLALYNLCHICMTFRLGVESSECFGSFWTWINMCGLLCVIVATVQLGSLQQIPGDDDISFSLCTFAIAFLWIMVLGFLSKWWKGANVFCARFVVVS